MALKYTSGEPLVLHDLTVQPGDVVRAGNDRERVLLSAYPDRFRVVKPTRRRARSTAERTAPADRSMRSPSDEG